MKAFLGRGAREVRRGLADRPRARRRPAVPRHPRRPRHARAGGGRPRRSSSALRAVSTRAGALRRAARRPARLRASSRRSAPAHVIEGVERFLRAVREGGLPQADDVRAPNAHVERAHARPTPPSRPTDVGSTGRRTRRRIRTCSSLGGRGLRRHAGGGRLPGRGAGLARRPRPGEGRPGGLLHRLPRGHDVRRGPHPRRQKAWQRTLFDHGWAGITWPTEFGGRGGTPMQSAIFTQEHGRYGVSGRRLRRRHRHGRARRSCATAPTSRRSGSCGRCCGATRCGASCSASPSAGSDLAGIATRAVRDGDEWVVTGQKVWTSMATDSRLGHPAGPHRSGRAEAQGHHLLPGRHAHAGLRHPAAAADDRVEPLQRGVPRRGAHPADQVLGEVHGGWACTDHDPVQRAGPDRRRQPAPPTPSRSSPWPRSCGRTDDPVLRQAARRLLDPPADPALPRLPAPDRAEPGPASRVPRPRS